MSHTKGRALRLRNNTPVSKNRQEEKMPSSQKNVVQLLDVTNVSNSSSVHSYNEKTPSKKYNQLRINLAYSEYLQRVILREYFKKTHRKYMRSIDQQLVYYSDQLASMFTWKIELQYHIEYIDIVVDIGTQLENLENNVTKGNIFDDEFHTILKCLSAKLQCLCSQLQLDNYTFVDNQENRQQLENMLAESIQIMKLQNDRHDDLVYILDRLMKSYSILKVINDRSRDISAHKNNVNNLVVKLSSYKLSGDL